jgi:Xaa-Pro aminopeptidase
MSFENRQLQFQQKLAEQSIDFACILKPHNVLYFSGWSPVCSGILMFPDLEPVYCTLWLDAPEGKKFCAIRNLAVYVFPQENLTGKIIQLIKKRISAAEKIGVEKDFILLKDYEMLLREFPDAEFVHITPIIDRMRAIKSKDEIENIKKASSISIRAMEAALGAVKPGVSELEIAAEAEYIMKKLGSEKPAFSTFVASGNRTLLAHPIASRRKLQPGDPVVIDLGASWEGYASDICRTTFVGEPSPEQILYLRLVAHAQKEAASILKA